MESRGSEPNQRSFGEHRCSPHSPRLSNSALAVEAPALGKASPHMRGAGDSSAVVGFRAPATATIARTLRLARPHRLSSHADPEGPHVAADEGETPSPRTAERRLWLAYASNFGAAIRMLAVEHESTPPRVRARRATNKMRLSSTARPTGRTPSRAPRQSESGQRKRSARGVPRSPAPEETSRDREGSPLRLRSLGEKSLKIRILPVGSADRVRSAEKIPGGSSALRAVSARATGTLNATH
jgi:hypothetical protein